MRSPIDVVKGRIVDVDSDGTVTIKVHYDDWHTLVKRQYKECNVQFIDSRKLSRKQRNMCYALLKDISEYTGMGLDPTKEHMKIKFLAEDLQQTADKIFSLSNAPMSLVCAFQRFLVHFILDWDIPCSMRLLDFVDDVDDYIYACLVAKKCCICGRKADLHHVDHVATGRDREEIIHEGMRVQPLCRLHHTEAHLLGQKTFNEKYHIHGGIELDKALCRQYGLKRKEQEESAEPSFDDGAVDEGP